MVLILLKETWFLSLICTKMISDLTFRCFFNVYIYVYTYTYMHAVDLSLIFNLCYWILKMQWGSCLLARFPGWLKPVKFCSGLKVIHGCCRISSKHFTWLVGLNLMDLIDGSSSSSLLEIKNMIMITIDADSEVPCRYIYTMTLNINDVWADRIF